MTTLRTGNQYAAGRLGHRIERALIDAGKNLGDLAPGDLCAVEDLHTSGRIATGRPAGLAEISSDDAVLDAAAASGHRPLSRRPVRLRGRGPRLCRRCPT
jgi:hypothetical protein